MKNTIKQLSDELEATKAQSQRYKEAWEAEKLISKAYRETMDKLKAKVRGFEKRAFRYGLIIGAAIGMFGLMLGIMIKHYV